MTKMKNVKKYFFSTPESYGDVFLSPTMVHAKRFIMNAISRKRHSEGYIEISSPKIMIDDVWKKTGHWQHYKENMFVFLNYAFKPRSCPGALIYVKNMFPHSFNSFPISIFEWGTVFRKERSGTLSTLRRLNAFTQDDAHVFCVSMEQIYEVVKSCMRSFIFFFDKILGWKFNIAISTRPTKSVSDNTAWEHSTNILKEVLRELNREYFIDDGEGAFYGPKVDFIFDTLENKNKKHGIQLGTIQLDFFLAKNLGLKFSGVSPYVVHFAMLGSLERFLSVLLEKSDGLPFWCLETPYVVVNLLKGGTPKLVNSISKLIKHDWELKVYNSGNSIQSLLKKYSDSSILFIGEKEEKDNKVSIRRKGSINVMSQPYLLSLLSEKIQDIRSFFC